MSRTVSLCAIFIAAWMLSACSDSAAPVTRAPAPSVKAAETVSAAPTAMDTFRTLAPPQGLKFTSLFAEPMDGDARLKRLEDSVQSLRNDFDTVVPSLVRLVAVEKDMKQLVTQLQTLTDTSAPPGEALPAPEVETPQPIKTQNTEIPGGDAAGGTETAAINKAGTKAPSSLVTPEAAPKGALPPEGAASPLSKPSAPAPAPVAAPPATPKTPTKPIDDMPFKESATPAKPAAPAKAEAPKPAAKTSGAAKAVRAGDHKDKTRVVIDLTARPGFKVTLADKNKTVIIDLPGIDLSAIKPYDAMSAALVGGWHAEDGKIKLHLIYPATIKAESLLEPKGGTNYRLVLDLFSKDVHR